MKRIVRILNDSKEKGKSDICTIVSKKKKIFLGEKKFFEHYGFEVIDNIGDYEFRQCGTYTIKDDKQYKIQTKDLCKQAKYVILFDELRN